MITVYLYGELRRYGDQPRPDADTVVTRSINDTITVAQLLAEIGIRPKLRPFISKLSHELHCPVVLAIPYRGIND